MKNIHVLPTNKPSRLVLDAPNINTQNELWGKVFAKIKQYGLNNEVLEQLKEEFLITPKI